MVEQPLQVTNHGAVSWRGKGYSRLKRIENASFAQNAGNAPCALVHASISGCWIRGVTSIFM
jgi:hypothetical protein